MIRHSFYQFHKLATVWSEGFLYKVAPPELKISPIMYFVIHNSVVLPKILKIVVLFWLLFVYVDYYQNNQFYRVKNWIFKILLLWHNNFQYFGYYITELWMTKYIIGEFFSSGGATLYKNPSDQTVQNYIFFLTYTYKEKNK